MQIRISSGRGGRIRLLRVAFALSAASLSARAQSPRDSEDVPRVQRTSENIRLDGRLDEPQWFLADSITDFRQKEPTEGGPPSARTVVRLLATPAGLAVGWWLSDADPAHIVRGQLRRDAELRSDDYVSMGIDGLSDQRTAFYFRTNANGALWDGEHLTFESGNEEWDGVWDARTQVTTDGWTAEMLIPWATLRYPRDVRTMGMNFRRFLPRTNEEVLWRAWKRGQGIRFLEAEGTIGGFEDLPPRARAEMRPYVLGEARLTERTYDAAGNDLVVAPAVAEAKAGLDVKIPVTNTLTADLTLFPDFAQAEVDRQVVNLTRFPLFFPEQRPFFTEGAQHFAFGRQQQTQMFYSRRVGLGTGGTPVAIPVGARMQGRVGRYQLGMLAARTADDEDATDLVVRVRRDVLRRGFVGAMSTYSDRPVRPGALAGGLDFDFPFVVRGGDNLVVNGNAAWSRDSAGGATGAHYRFVVDYPNDHADLVVRFDRVDAAYDPALGFVSQRGIYRLGGSTAITPRPRQPSRIRRLEFNLLNYDVVWDLDGRLDNVSFSVRPFGAQFQTGGRVELNVIRR
ncbi:MAG: carbohydrate binding family 9 domain-containing protein, partial [Gemmatimonadota bacterium]|nr:carbohydrate binding family 9 domain-containing protein [Gemmatimonadota bacterium]